MAPAEPPVLTGQDIGEAEGALTAVLEGVLRSSELNRTEYITLQVLATRGPFEAPANSTSSSPQSESSDLRPCRKGAPDGFTRQR
jgi:hypothetical protein